MAALDNIASELLKSANEADLIYKKTRDQAQRDKAVRLRRIVENLKLIIADGLTPTLDEVLAVGNTSTNSLNVGGITSDYFQLDTAATPTLAPGMFAWNDAYGTADLRLKGGNVTLQVGQETLARVVNKTGADLLESQYKVVRVRIASEGGSQGQRLAVVLAQGNNDPDSATTLGIVTENIANNHEGFITIFGNVNGINTTGSLQGETWVDGDVLYLSPTTPGSLTKVKPQAPQHTLIVGYVLYAHNNQGKIFVKVDNGYELDELHNVLINGVANNDLLQYDGTTQVWKNKSISTIFGGTPLVSVPTLAQVTTAGNTTTNAITVGGLIVDTNVLVVDSVNNRVGIGTTNPQFKLDILDTTGNLFNFRYSGASYGVAIDKVVGILGFSNTANNNDYTKAFAYRLSKSTAIATQTDVKLHIDLLREYSFSAATDYSLLSTGKVTAITLDGAGNVGIGTSSPAFSLDVQTTGTTVIRSYGTTVGRVSFQNASKHYSISTQGTNLYFFDETAGVSRMLLDTAGNLGIGTTSPSSKLTVLNTANTVAALIGGGAAAPGWVGLGTVNSGALPFIQGYNNAVSGTVPLSLNPGGSNVLIGTATDAGYKLDVNGTFRATGAAILGGAVTFSGTSFRISPNEFQGSVTIPNTLDATNNTCYINIGTFSDSFTHIVVEVELVPWLLNTSNIGSYSKTYVIRMTSAGAGVVDLYSSNVTKDIGPTGDKYQLGTPIANGSNLLQIPVKYIGAGSGNQISANIRVTGAVTGNIDKVSLSVGTPSAVSAGTQEYVSFRNRIGIGTTTPTSTLHLVSAANTSAIVSTGYSVTGSGSASLVDLSGTWNTTGTPTLIKANLTDTASNASSFLIDLQVAGSSQFRVRKDGYARASQGFVIGTSNGNDLVSSSGGETYVAGGLFTSLRFASSSTEGYGLTISGFNASTRTNTSGAAGVLQLAHGFAPTSGVGTFIGLLYRGTINQTGGASGVTRGLYVNPTLTAAADWRSIEWSNNSGWGLYGVGTALNYLNGALLIGATANAGYKLDVNGTARIQSNLTVASLTTDGPVKSVSGMLVSVAGYTGSFTVPTNPPGMQTLDIQDGIIVNIL